jgi:hypothetical protein
MKEFHSISIRRKNKSIEQKVWNQMLVYFCIWILCMLLGPFC